MTFIFSAFSEEELLKRAKTVGRHLQPGMVIALEGPLGIGKTTFVRGVLRGLGYKGSVKSPTYTLIEEYRFSAFVLYHVDLYRLLSPEELEFIGLSDYWNGQAVIFIEWPEKGLGFLPKSDVQVCFKMGEAEERIVEWTANTQKGESFLLSYKTGTQE
ncbi:MAG: tRNA (adenosine(37)-N6)-threonylcarbamoyltransferase complex ATPase subunit type 1 TsaE [Gammaproteobacteria bacterium]|nr:tRNA (adenosine(37)-N6)-threonylcarbamoyltransferase complex ATPase subunit type 1 TsaE [Gammaproteobacteria bacterium]